MSELSFAIYTQTKQLPPDWKNHSAKNIFLGTDYLKVLEESAPQNMRCFFIGLFQQEKLEGIALAQFLDLSEVESFGDRDSCLKTKIRQVVFKKFSSKVLFIGNNMLTGQNAFSFSENITVSQGLRALHLASADITKELRQQGTKTHLTVWKDFYQQQANDFKVPEFADYYRFSTQPNMVFQIRPNWLAFDHYTEALLKKYRDQYKRARKKADGLDKQKFTLPEIIQYNSDINRLYLTVAQNAPFNTFYLSENHFVALKRELGDRFLFYGYFNQGKLVGFSTLIQNGNDIDTYFLGYDEHCQREKMLYLNMLYDMTAYSINKGFSKIIFARTALEIKSSVGAEPLEMFGLIKHSNPAANYFMSKLFKYFEPELSWQQRHPFKS